MNVIQKLEKITKAEAPGAMRLSPFESRLHDEAAAAFVYEHGAEVLAALLELPKLRAWKDSQLIAIEEDGAEFGRLQQIEVAARDMLAELDSEGRTGYYMRQLAKALRGAA